MNKINFKNIALCFVLIVPLKIAIHFSLFREVAKNRRRGISLDISEWEYHNFEHHYNLAFTDELHIYVFLIIAMIFIMWYFNWYSIKGKDVDEKKNITEKIDVDKIKDIDEKIDVDEKKDLPLNYDDFSNSKEKKFVIIKDKLFGYFTIITALINISLPILDGNSPIKLLLDGGDFPRFLGHFIGAAIMWMIIYYFIAIIASIIYSIIKLKLTWIEHKSFLVLPILFQILVIYGSNV